MSCPHPKISKGFYQSISTFRETHELEDFKVKVDEDVYSCHSFILGSCSEFFRRLLQTDMKEKQEMKVDLKNISSPIFQLILDSLYTGCEILTKENVLRVWSAVHQLQIKFLIEHCEDFVIANLSYDTIEIYKEQSEYLQSERVSEHIFNFMLKNFETFRENEIFLRLDFPYLTKLLQSDSLQVTSEDIVLYSIFDWVNYGNILPNNNDAMKDATANDSTDDLLNTLIQNKCTLQKTEEPNQEIANSELNNDVNAKEQQTQLVFYKTQSIERKNCLVHLMKATRYCLASEKCIIRLYKDKLIQSDILIKDSFFEAFTFKFCDYSHDYWPTTAIHRDCSGFEHVGVFCDSGGILALSLKQENIFHIKLLKNLQNTKLTIFKEELYACSIGTNPLELYIFQSNAWVRVTDFLSSIQILLTHEKYIYVFHSCYFRITRFNPESSHMEHKTFQHKVKNIQYGLSFHNNIVVFSSVDNSGVEETNVDSWNTETNVWSHFGTLKFSSKIMTSFRNEREIYILDSHGILFKLTKNQIIEFILVAKLWSGHFNIRGTLLFRETLFIVAESLGEVDMLEKVEGVFSRTCVWQITGKTSNVVHYVMPKIMQHL